jgi:site-specific recombinase XerD
MEIITENKSKFSKFIKDYIHPIQDFLSAVQKINIETLDQIDQINIDEWLGSTTQADLNKQNFSREMFNFVMEYKLLLLKTKDRIVLCHHLITNKKEA